MKLPLIFKLGLKESLAKQDINHGAIYVTEDTCEIFYDIENDRK